MDFSGLLASGGHLDLSRFYANISGFLAAFYVCLALMNAIAAYYCWDALKKNLLAGVWLFLVLFLVISAAKAGDRHPFELPEFVRDGLNWALSGTTGAVVFTVGAAVALAVMFLLREFFVHPVVAWLGFNFSLIFLALSMTDQNFWGIVAKPDNVPIVGLIFLLGFFTWLATYKAVINDNRIAKGLPPVEKEGDEKVLVWPDLVYTELICMIALTAFLLFWGMALQAPLEQQANPVLTPNPSKAPWYFLGLQEMLVYFDPWYAGVVAPSMIVAGLIAIPYLDFNKKGIGYYTISERKFAYLTFQFGFFILWVTLIILGTFLRGPNWNFFGPYELWDPHRVEVQNNVHLDEMYWHGLLDRPMPKAPSDAGFFLEIGYILKREAPGMLLMAGYFLLIPPILAVTVMRRYFVRMGFIRFMVLTNLLLFMATLPIKMALRWTLNMKYIIHIDEYFLNF